MSVFCIFAALAWLSHPSHTSLVTALPVCPHTSTERTPGDGVGLQSPALPWGCAQTPREVRQKPLWQAELRGSRWLNVGDHL